MRDSIGGSMLLNLVIIFAGLVIALFMGILSYSKAYGVKNRIIEIIEKYGTYEKIESGKNLITEELNPDLAAFGYNASAPTKCDSIKERLKNEKYGGNLDEVGNLNKYGYNYCVFQINNSENSTGKSFVVVSFIHFEVPIISNVVTIPVYGETKILGKTYDY